MDKTYMERVKQYPKENYPLLIEICDTRLKAIVEKPEQIPTDLSFYVIALRYRPTTLRFAA